MRRQEASQHALTERGYELDREGQEAQNRANTAAVELERAAARERANAERVSELETRIAAAGAELEQTRTQLSGIAEERTQQHSFLADGGRRGAAPFASRWRRASRRRARRPKRSLRRSGSWRASRRHAMHLLTLAGNARNHTAQGEESLAALEREAERLEAEMGQARSELENLGAQSGQARLRFESAAEALKRLESEIAALREALQARRAEEAALRARVNQLRGEQATVAGRRDSLQSLIRNHSYSTDTVRRLLKPGALAQGMAPVGTLADFHRGERRA